MKEQRKCPKCGYVRTEADDGRAPEDICPNCGVVYSKVMPGPHQWKTPVQKKTHQPKNTESTVALSKTTKCPDCGGTVSINAATCPHCGAPLKPTPEQEKEAKKVADSKNAGLGCLTIIVIVAAITIFNSFFDSDNSGSTRTPKEVASATYYQCEQLVKQQLKAPSTADFPWGANAVIPVNGRPGEFELHSYVDAQNSFGAKIRTPFICRVTVTGQTGTATSALLIP